MQPLLKASDGTIPVPKIKIGHFLGNPGGIGGAETMVVNLCKEQIAQDMIPEVYLRAEYCDDTWMHQQGRKHGFNVICLPPDVLRSWSIYKLPQCGYHLARFFQRRSVDIVHSHMYGAALRGALATSLFSSIPHVATMHDNYTIEEKPSRLKWLQLAAKAGTHIVTISNQMWRVYSSGMPKNRLHMIYNGSYSPEEFQPLSEFERAHLRKSIGVEPNETMYIYVGRLEPIKGVNTLLKAFACLHSRDHQLIIAGDGSQELPLMSLATKLGIGDRVIFLGARDDVPDLLHAADAFVLASHSEGLSCSLIEAISAKLPCLVTDVGGNREIIKAGESGMIVEDDWATFKNALKIFHNTDKEDKEAMGIQGHRTAMSRFSTQGMARMYLTVYTELLRQ